MFPSREKARRAIMAGWVEVCGQRVDKAGAAVDEDAEVEVTGGREPYVSRGGLKLEAALDHFRLSPEGRVCLDVGASTGGFTDCLLQRGASRVYALDVGYGQLDYSLRREARVVVMERLNVRYLEPDALPERVRLATLDVSFISLLKVVPAVLPHLEPGGWLLPLIKPQFEAGKGAVGKGGILRDEDLRRRVVEQVVAGLVELGLEPRGTFDSPVAGAGGNREVFALLRKIPEGPGSGRESGKDEVDQHG